MRKKFLLAICFLASCSDNSSYPLLDGGSIDMASPDKILVINYWAIWCAPCRKEIPELNELAVHHKDDLIVIGVNFDGSQNEVLRKEIAKLGIAFPSLIEDPRSRWNLEPVSILPETLIISADGKLLNRLVGPQTSAYLEALL